MASIGNKNRIMLRLKRPHITEKASMLSAGKENAYTFEIEKGMNKQDVKNSIKEIYNVIPVSVNIINLPSKKVFMRGKWGVKSGIKKAVVYLKKGEKIDFI